MPKLTLDDLPEIRKLLADGNSQRTIAKVFQVHHTTLGAFLKKAAPDVPTRASDRPPTNLSVAESRPMKLLVIDIETMANLGWHWGTWQQNIAPSQIVKHKRVISFAAKWFGHPDIAFFGEWTAGGRRAMITTAWENLNHADGVIGYNSKRFDVKHLNTEFAVEGLTPPAPFAHIDLMNTVKREFAFGSNKLDSVSDRLELGRKEEHEGFGLWLKVEAGDPDARARMQSYNEHDVLLTERLYEKILPWITNHPSYAAFARSDVPMCSNCGSEAVREAGWHHARTRRYQRYHCTRCGHWMRDRKAEQITDFTETSSY